MSLSSIVHALYFTRLIVSQIPCASVSDSTVIRRSVNAGVHCYLRVCPALQEDKNKMYQLLLEEDEKRSKCILTLCFSLLQS